MSKPFLKVYDNNSLNDNTDLPQQVIEILKVKEKKVLEDCKNRKIANIKYTGLQQKLLGVHLADTESRS
tara:strand:+ start:3942 stop:4148 length:207 start_codon:yes stop_codon:yes gene_type:complete